MNYQNCLILLVEPSFHGLQYIELLEQLKCDYIGLRRSEGPIATKSLNYLIIDFNNPDEACVTIETYIKNKNYQEIGIIPGNDFCVPIVCALNERLGLRTNSYEAGWGARNKIKMRELLCKAKVPCPQYSYFYDLESIKAKEQEYKYPLVVKPSDMCSSKHVKFVENYEELIAASKVILDTNENYLHYQKEIAVLIEEYVEGLEFSVELLLEEGEILFSSVTEKHKGELPYFVEMAHVVPSTITTAEENNQLIQVSLKAAQAIGLWHGPIHAELTLTNHGPSIIEVAGRVGGDNIMFLVKYATGVYIPEMVVNQLLNRELNIPQKQNKGSAICFISGKPGVITSINGWEQCLTAKSIIDGKLLVGVGDRIHSITSSEDRIGYVIAMAEDGKKAYECAMNAIASIDIRTTIE